ncbi:MAG: hypothetical protein R2708_12730 [Vicinamibacterales bacterium]
MLTSVQRTVLLWLTLAAAAAVVVTLAGEAAVQALAMSAPPPA